MRLTTENLQTPINPELDTAFENLLKKLQTAINSFKNQPIGNLYRTIHCKFFESTLIDLHLIGKSKIFDACIDQAQSCGLDVSPLQNALQMLKNLCDESIESNKKIENIEAYIQDNVVLAVEKFRNSLLPANKKPPVENSLTVTNQQPDGKLAFEPSRLPKELIHQLLSFLIPIETPLYSKGMAALSLTCWTWHGHLIVDLKNKRVELDKLMQRSVQPLIESIVDDGPETRNYVLISCLKDTPYKEYFLKYLVNEKIYKSEGFLINLQSIT